MSSPRGPDHLASAVLLLHSAYPPGTRSDALSAIPRYRVPEVERSRIEAFVLLVVSSSAACSDRRQPAVPGTERKRCNPFSGEQNPGVALRPPHGLAGHHELLSRAVCKPGCPTQLSSCTLAWGSVLEVLGGSTFGYLMLTYLFLTWVSSNIASDDTFALNTGLIRPVFVPEMTIIWPRGRRMASAAVPEMVD